MSHSKRFCWKFDGRDTTEKENDLKTVKVLMVVCLHFTKIWRKVPLCEILPNAIIDSKIFLSILETTNALYKMQKVRYEASKHLKENEDSVVYEITT